MMRRFQEGFTLVELVVTTGIIALLSTSAMLSFPPMIEAYRLKEATSLIVGVIREAQMRSVREARPWRVVIDSDGRGYALQSASDSAVNTTDCTSMAGWTASSMGRFHSSLKIETSTMSRSCVVFNASGRGDWPNPEALLPTTSTQPTYGTHHLLRVADGIELDPNNLPNNPTFDPVPILWWKPNPLVLVLTVGEVRYYSSVCVGMYSNPPTYRYPSNIRVEASASPAIASAQWTVLYDQPGPSNPPNYQRARTCVKIPVNASYRYFRLTSTPNGNYIVLDEIKAADLYFTLTGPRKTNRLTISPVTGRVTVQPL